MGRAADAALPGRRRREPGRRGDERAATALGAAFTAASVGLSSVGSLTASRNGARGLPLWPALGFGMLYSAFSSALALALMLALTPGASLAQALPPASARWWLALVYLAVAGSVLAFGAWLTLQERVGPGPSSAVGVAAPVLAIAVSIAFEGYRPGVLTGLGVILAVLGNVWMLSRGARVGPRPAA